jgi:hypothetical protein
LSPFISRSARLEDAPDESQQETADAAGQHEGGQFRSVDANAWLERRIDVARRRIDGDEIADPAGEHDAGAEDQERKDVAIEKGRAVVMRRLVVRGPGDGQGEGCQQHRRDGHEHDERLTGPALDPQQTLAVDIRNRPHAAGEAKRDQRRKQFGRRECGRDGHQARQAEGRDEHRNQHEPVQDDVSQDRRDQGPHVRREQPELRREVAAEPSQLMDRRRLGGDAEHVLLDLDGAERSAGEFVRHARNRVGAGPIGGLPMNPRRQPTADVAATGHRRQVFEARQEAVFRETLQDAEAEGRASNTAARKAERRQPIVARVYLLVQCLLGWSNARAGAPIDYVQFLSQHLGE